MEDFEEYDEYDEYDEDGDLSKIYAEADMKEKKDQWFRNTAEEFYSDISKLDTEKSVDEIHKMIEAGELKFSTVIELLDNMIKVFQADEEYEKCKVCLDIKKELIGE